MTEENDAPLKAYNAKELAAMYGIDQRTFSRWVNDYEDAIGPKSGRFFNVLQVEIIFQVMGRPKLKKTR
jgi:hypothetical protein